MSAYFQLLESNLISEKFQNWTLIQDVPAKKHFDTGAEIEIWRDDIGLLTLSRPNKQVPNRFRLRFSDGIVLDIWADENLILNLSSPSKKKSTDLDHFLADQVFPRLLSHEGKFVLHAGSTSIDDRAILLVGPSGCGKSTLAASFKESGGSLIGDDAMVVVPQNGLCHVSAVYPSLRLMPDSVCVLFPDAPVSTSVATYTSKRRITLPIEVNEPRPVPVAAIFVLSEPMAAEGVHLRRMTIAESCMALVGNSFALDPTDAQLARIRLNAASELARQAPAFALFYPRHYARLPEVRETILATLRGL